MLIAITFCAAFACTATTADVIDGDTIYVDHQRIRLASYDAPEIFHPRCQNELLMGQQARSALITLLDGGTVKLIGLVDKYQRPLAEAFTHEGRNVGDELIAQNLALTFVWGSEPYRMRALHWCTDYVE